MGLLKYSNGWGHLIMSLASLGVGVYLIILGYSTIGVSLIGTVSAAWFIPGAAKQVAASVSQALPEPAATQIAQATGTQTPAAQTKISNAINPQKKRPSAG